MDDDKPRTSFQLEDALEATETDRALGWIACATTLACTAITAGLVWIVL